MKKRLLVFVLMLAMMFTFIPVASAGIYMSASLDVTPRWVQTNEYNWSVTNNVNPVSLEIKQGETGTVAHEVKVTKDLVKTTDVYGVNGQISLTYNGAVPTKGLAISITIQTDSGAGFEDYQIYNLDLSSNPVLDTGETGVYPFGLIFDPVDGANYRIYLNCTILNYEGVPGFPFGPDGYYDFSFPTSPSVTSVNSVARLFDEGIFALPGFEITSDFSPQNFTSAGFYAYNISYKNVSADYNKLFTGKDIVSLKEMTTLNVLTANGEASIYTGSAPVTVLPQNSDFWKNNCGFRNKNQNLVSEYLPIWLGNLGGRRSDLVINSRQAFVILSKNNHNELSDLKAQLLTAKLNIANGVDGSAISPTIAQADQFLAANRFGLSRSVQREIQNLVNKLAAFNSGN